MRKPVFALALGRVGASMARFRDDERGSMALIIIFTFLAMIMFGGIAVDVMRFEVRRVAMQQTLDRAALAAAGLPQERDPTKVRTPEAIAKDWFDKADLDVGLDMVEVTGPFVDTVDTLSKREVTISASVRSQNFFMGIFSPRDFLEGPASTKAAQGVSNVEVMLVLDITDSMKEVLDNGDTKLQALQKAVVSFVDIIDANDVKKGISIGVVPYAGQVNVPLELREQFTVSDLASWGGTPPGTGVPNINCLEFPTSGFGDTGVSLTTPIPMAAVADANSNTDRSGRYVAPQMKTEQNTMCSTADADRNGVVDVEANLLLMPTKNRDKVKDKVLGFTTQFSTYIAVGMRWGTALLDEDARPIYDALLAGEPSMKGRPADNGSRNTRKIIVLMTDGEHYTNRNIFNPVYKSGPSPIYRGQDGRFAIRFENSAAAAPIRPGSGTSATTSCSGWQLTDYEEREYFVPHLKRDSVRQRVGSNPEGMGTGAIRNGACDPQAWLAAGPGNQLTWTGSGAVRQLDWSEVWRYVRVSWVVQQLYVRSGVTGFTDYDTVIGSMQEPYLKSTTNMDTLLQQNCDAARGPAAQGGAGIEIYGILFDKAPTTRGIAAINGCASLPKSSYYYEPKSAGDITSAFNQIATDISDLRLTQ